VVFEQGWSVIMCGFGTVLFSGYIVWFGNSVGQWLYCVVLDQWWSKLILCGLGKLLVTGNILWFLNRVG
jgi:hypothetical protein